MQKRCARGCQNDINIEQQVYCVSAPTEDERGIRLGFNKPQGEQVPGKPVVPCSGRLLQSVQGFVQATDQVRVSWIREPCGLTAKNSLAEGAVEEGVLHIELLNGPVTGDGSSEHRANGGRFHNRAKSLIIVDPEAQSETPVDPASLIEI
jgi:hypothetical protein